jgi:uncharacterized membrane protein (DUF485 family)
MELAAKAWTALKYKAEKKIQQAQWVNQLGVRNRRILWMGNWVLLEVYMVFLTGQAFQKAWVWTCEQWGEY